MIQERVGFSLDWKHMLENPRLAVRWQINSTMDLGMVLDYSGRGRRWEKDANAENQKQWKYRGDRRWWQK